MEGKRFRVGSVAILFAVAALCMAIFCTLTAVTAVSDAAAARQYGEHVRQVYHCENLGQEWLRDAERYLTEGGTLPENTWQDGSQIGTEILDGAMRLVIRLENTEQGYAIRQWSRTTQWQPEEHWNLWQEPGQS